MADQPLFGTPTSTPEQRKFSRELAAALLKEGMSAQPIRSPWQGVGHIVQALVGGYMANKADTKENEERARMAEEIIGARRSGDVAQQAAIFANPNIPERVAGEGLRMTYPQVQGTIGAGGVSYPNVQAPGAAAAPPPVPVQSAPIPSARPAQPNLPVPPQPQNLTGDAIPPGGTSGTGPYAPRAVHTVPAGSSMLPPSMKPIIEELSGIDREQKAKEVETQNNAKSLAALREEGLSASQRLDEMKQFKELAKSARYGISPQLKLWAANRGLRADDNVSVEQLYNDMIMFKAPQLRPEGSGRLIGQEMTNFQASLGGLLRTPQGREAAIDFITRRDQWMHNAGKRALEPRGNDAEKINDIYNLKMPSIDLKSLMAKPTREQAIEELKKRGVAGF